MTQHQTRTDGPAAAADTIDQLRRAMGTLESGEATVEEALQELGVEVDQPSGELTRIPESSATDPGAVDGSTTPQADEPRVDHGQSADSSPNRDLGQSARRDRGPVRRSRSGWAVRAPREPEEGLSDRELEQQARDIVLRRLESSDRTRAELADSLAERQIPTRIADQVLDRMTEVGLINDEAFARGWVASRQQRKHLSRRMLTEELRRKGIDPGLAQDVVAPVDEDDEYEAAVALVRKRLPAMERLEPSVQRRRLAGLLARRGFGSGLVFRVLDDVLEGHR
ncbi:regulatory protein RecX [Propionibacteriaceae bacterium Y1685]|uniref:regulatory protein RecX n=1 Tax=Microlunatus sp. Y1700 TaxID=3418487 RepID=UPI003B794F08